MTEEPNTRDGDLRDDSGGRLTDGAPEPRETYYTLERDGMLRVDRRQERRPQTYWVASDHMEPRFADHVQLTRVDHHYHLTFGQSRVPIAREDSETAAVSVIQPVARVILPEEVSRRLAAALQHKLPDQ
ncbi:MAG: hypothetical protein JSW51_12045 [Gemmatimonadota bacterium]|nr:MAG: hypothetical protein JSW51_12045 [Gemmatimonadota bacterium]